LLAQIPVVWQWDVIDTSLCTSGFSDIQSPSHLSFISNLSWMNFLAVLHGGFRDFSRCVSSGMGESLWIGRFGLLVYLFHSRVRLFSLRILGGAIFTDNR